MQELQTSLTEFEHLKDRLRKANEYFSTKHDTDTPENQAKAVQAVEKIKARMSELWEQMIRTVDLDTGRTVDDLVVEIKTFANEYLYPVKVNYHKKSQRITVRLEPPAYWANLITRVYDN